MRRNYWIRVYFEGVAESLWKWLTCGVWEKEGVNNASKILGTIYWKNGISINYDGEDYKNNQEFGFEIVNFMNHSRYLDIS